MKGVGRAAALATLVSLSLLGHPAKAERVLVTKNNISVVIENEQSWCSKSVDLAFRSDNPAVFSGDRAEVQKILGGLRAIMGFECPQVEEILLRGQVGGSEVFRGNSSKSNGWILAELGTAKTLHEQQQQRQNQNQPTPHQNQPTPTAAPTAAQGNPLATGIECGDINGWAAGSYNTSRTEELFGKGVREWSDADFAQASSRVSACRAPVDQIWRGRTDKSLTYLSEAKRSLDTYRAETQKLDAETQRLTTVFPPEDAEQFFNRLDEINQAPPYGGVIVSSYGIQPEIPSRNELKWKIDTRPYEQALKDLNARFVAKMPDHIPFLMEQLRNTFIEGAQKMPEMSAKVKGLKGQDLTWTFPQEIEVTSLLSEFCAQSYAEITLRGEQTAVFKKGCEKYVSSPSQEVIDAFKRDLSAIPASIDDMVALRNVCNAIVAGDALKRACSEQVAALRQDLNSEDQKLAKAWLGEPLSCEEAVQVSDMDEGDLKETFFLALTGLFQTTQTSFFEQVCAAAPQGVQMVFDGQGMFSGPDELFIQTNERILLGLQPVQITLKSIEGPNGEDLYFGSHIKAEVWDSLNEAVRVEDRSLERTTLMEGASYPSEWYNIKECMNSSGKRRMGGTKSCEKMAGILLYPYR